jgi:isoquinoline 1-oxidoreductase beta subunit
MEPMNCTCKISTAGRAEVWVPTQNGEASLAALSEQSGLPLDRCEVYKQDLGGGFGRRGGSQDFVRQAVNIAKQFPDVPIKMIWSREEDMAHDFYRPISQCKLAAGLDESGKPVALHVRISGQSINAFVNPAAIPEGNKDERQLQGYSEKPGDAQLGYTFPPGGIRTSHVPVGPWRGVNATRTPSTGMLHRGSGARPARTLEFRRALMSKHRSIAVTRRPRSRLRQAAAPACTRKDRAVHGIQQLFGGCRRGSVNSEGKLKIHRMVLRSVRSCGQSRSDRGPGRRLGRLWSQRCAIR